MSGSRLALTALLLFSVSCGSDRPDQALNQPAVLDLAAFPELPLPSGYFLSNADDQVAVAMVGGSIRHAVLVYLGDNKRDDLMQGDELADWFDRRLRPYGWQRQEQWLWRHPERHERLRLETGRRENTPTIRFLLRHQPRGQG